VFCALNGHDRHVPTEEAVRTMLSVAAGELDEQRWPNGTLCGLIEKTDDTHAWLFDPILGKLFRWCSHIRVDPKPAFRDRPSLKSPDFAQSAQNV
jgi:hypothetical protein